MKKKFFAFFIAAAFILNAVGFVSADTRSVKKQVNPLLALLPASDAVISIDAKRFYNTALPQILSGNKEMLDDIYGEIDEMKRNTGIDVRQFENVAVGIAFNQISATDIDFEPVALARGSFNASSLAALAKYASNNNYREEKVGSRTVYIFSAKELIEKQKTIVKNSVIQKIFDHLLPRASGEVAVAAYDNNTLAFGKLERLKLMLTDEKSRVDAGLLAAVNRNPNAVMSFAAKFPNGISGFIKLSDDELGRNLNSIRRISGNVDVTAENVSVSVAAKTFDIPHAQGLYNNLTVLRDWGTGLLGSSKNANNKIYARLLENAKITRSGSEVLLDLLIAQSDVNLLIGAK
jgi:hypothetical protein